MSPFELLAVVTTAAAVFAWLNARFVRLPSTIGLLIFALVGSLALVASGRLGWFDTAPLEQMLGTIDFAPLLLDGMLGALLFAGALHVDLDDLRQNGIAIGVLATVGVALCTLLMAGAAWGVTRIAGVPLPFAWALVFGALIAPTDPIAVGAILKSAGVPRRLANLLVGESLFNDGVAVVLFLVLLGVATGGGEATVGAIGELFLIEAGGGVLFGVILGVVVNRMLARVDEYVVEILLTIGVVTGGYALSQRLHISGALAMVVAGLLIGSRGRAHAMSERTRARLDDFWELADEFLNAALFVLIGVEVTLLEFSGPYVAIGLVLFPLGLLARWLSASAPLFALGRHAPLTQGTLTILTWAGLRGGISVALALSTPLFPQRPLLLTVTYVIVCLSIVGQGLTVERVVRRALPSSRVTDAPDAPDATAASA